MTVVVNAVFQNAMMGSVNVIKSTANNNCFTAIYLSK